MQGIPLGCEELLVQTKNGQLRYNRVFINGLDFPRQNSDRLGRYTNARRQHYTDFRLDVVDDRPLDSYEADLVKEIRKWEAIRKPWSPAPQEQGLEEVNVVFDLLFFWECLGGETFAQIATQSGFMLWGIADAGFADLAGTLVDSGIEAAFKPFLTRLFRVANIRSEWALEVASGLTTKLTSEKVMETLSPEKSLSIMKSGWWPPAPEAVAKLNTVMAFRRLVGAGSIQSKSHPGNR